MLNAPLYPIRPVSVRSEGRLEADVLSAITHVISRFRPLMLRLFSFSLPMHSLTSGRSHGPRLSELPESLCVPYGDQPCGVAGRQGGESAEARSRLYTKDLESTPQELVRQTR